MKKTALLIVLLVITLSSAAFATTVTLEAAASNEDGVYLVLLIDDATAGTFRLEFLVTNDELLQYNTWTGFRDAIILPKVSAALTEKRQIISRSEFLQSKVGLSITIP